MKRSQRSYQPELIDLGSSYYSKEEYEECLHQLSKIGRFLGGDKATLKTFHKLPKPKTIVEVGSGGGQFTIQLAQKFPDAQVLGIDTSREAIDFSQRLIRDMSLKNIKFEVSTSGQLSFPQNSVDVVTSTLVCHHLNDNQLIDFLRRSCQIAKKSVVINDLHRHWLAYLGFFLIAGLFFRNRLIFHDGLLSIKRAFKKQDWIDYLKAAEIPLEYCSITWHWAFRWVVYIDTSFNTENK